MNRPSFSTPRWVLSFCAFVFVFFFSCQKQLDKSPSSAAERGGAKTDDPGHLKQTKTFSSDALFRWIDFQLSLYKTNAGATGGIAGMRYAAYTGIAAYEAVVPGMPSYQSLSGQLTGLSGLPQTEPGMAYYWPECMNAALASVTTALFPAPAGGKPAQDLAIKNFRDGLHNEFAAGGASDELLTRSAAFGEAVATRIVDWANTDKSNWPPDFALYPNFNPPVGTDAPGDNSFDVNVGRWVRTAPANVALAYWGYTRLFSPSALNGVQRVNPYTYSKDPGTTFYNMNMAIYNNSYNPHGYSAADRLTIARYYAAPGYGAGFYLSVTKQILAKSNPTLDISALLVAQTGIAGEDAGIGCVQLKYENYVVRPQTFIRKIFGNTTWLPPIGQPNHPEWPSGHSTLAGAVGQVLIRYFGDDYAFIDRSFVDFTGADHFYARYHSSIQDFQHEIGDSRVYGQIHHPQTCEESIGFGAKVADNILSSVKFKKE